MKCCNVNSLQKFGQVSENKSTGLIRFCTSVRETAHGKVPISENYENCLIRGLRKMLGHEVYNMSY